MKFFVAFAAIVAVASSAPMINPVPSNILQEIQAIAAAIHNPDTEPLTAGLLSHLLSQIIAAVKPDVDIGPAIVEHDPISVGPAVIDTPLPVHPVQPVQPSPVVIGPIAPGAPAPLVQVIVNINSPDGTVAVESGAPVRPVPVETVDRPEPVAIDPVVVADPEIPIEPVDVVEVTPIEIEPVIIGTPILPVPVVILPEELN